MDVLSSGREIAGAETSTTLYIPLETDHPWQHRPFLCFTSLHDPQEADLLPLTQPVLNVCCWRRPPPCPVLQVSVAITDSPGSTRSLKPSVAQQKDKWRPKRRAGRLLLCNCPLEDTFSAALPGCCSRSRLPNHCNRVKPYLLPSSCLSKVAIGTQQTSSLPY